MSFSVVTTRVADRGIAGLRGARLRAYEATAWVLLVGPHDDGDRAADVYARLYELLGFDVSQGARTKPPCCAETGEPPQLSETETDPFNVKI